MQSASLAHGQEGARVDGVTLPRQSSGATLVRRVSKVAYLDFSKAFGTFSHSILTGVLIKPLSIIYQQSWLNGEVPADWKLANVTPIHKKGWKEDLGNYRPVSLTSVPGKVMEQIILSAIMWHVQDNQAIRPSQHGYMKGRSCLTNTMSFCDKVTCLVDERKAVDVVYLVDFSKAFDTVSHGILLDKLAARGLDGYSFHWVKELTGWQGLKSGGEWS
ncbi:rna-directed dna polymerase from mobile element jockey-like [Limosa lapponica baueri]|uniref:Rna-directed dna polymerase from mobile element jockey-like n=1 Tax=Limosa lapponica baueri TaxID=1758121 RepID=A0A2I0T298_LIMLA|nr:rna-directed dna polymerase from mobile element jockey-like [Limosa lapponica baueri]